MKLASRPPRRHALFVALAIPFAGCATQRLPAPVRAAQTVTSAARTADSRGPASAHADALGRLLDAPIVARIDRKRVVVLPLPDGDAWTHVKFWTVTTLAGYRYGDDHHAAFGVFTFAPTHSADGFDTAACVRRFAAWGERRGGKFDLRAGEPREDAIAWMGAGDARIARVVVLDAARRTLFGTRRYSIAYAAYPAWKEACLVVGVAVPSSDDGGHAGAVRDRFVRDTFPAITVATTGGVAALEYAEAIGEP